MPRIKEENKIPCPNFKYHFRYTEEQGKRPIEVLDLSTRAENALKHLYAYKTKGDANAKADYITCPLSWVLNNFERIDDKEWTRIPVKSITGQVKSANGLGEKSINEIKTKLFQYYINSICARDSRKREELGDALLDYADRLAEILGEAK